MISSFCHISFFVIALSSRRFSILSLCIICNITANNNGIHNEVIRRSDETIQALKQQIVAPNRQCESTIRQFTEKPRGYVEATRSCMEVPIRGHYETIPEVTSQLAKVMTLLMQG
jgi:hypothetical protein